MTNLVPQLSGSVTTNLGEDDLTSVSLIDKTGWPSGVKGFKIMFWDVNQNGSTQGFTLRTRTSALVTSGYKSWSIEQPVSGGTSVITTSTIRWDVQGISGSSLSHGYFECMLLDSSTFDWGVNGQFYDANDDSIMNIHGWVNMFSEIEGFRVQSAPGSLYTSGKMSSQYWT